MAWMADTVLHFAIIGKQQQPLAVLVQPPGGIDTRFIYEVRQHRGVTLRP